MDVARILERTGSAVPDRSSHILRGVLHSFSLGLFAPFAFSLNLCAQSHTVSQSVHIAVEPNLMDSTAPAAWVPPDPPSAQSRIQLYEESKAVEPERLPLPAKESTSSGSESSSKKSTNFLPPQRPIGLVNIDVKSKPKGENNVLPEDLAQGSQGDQRVIHASAATEMLDRTGLNRRCNADGLVPYQPLYFEEVNLERYGRGRGPLQPALSGARFFATIPSLPYAMAVHNPNQAYTFKWPNEAGWGAPKVRELQPLEFKPAAIQAATVTGLLFVVP